MSGILKVLDVCICPKVGNLSLYNNDPSLFVFHQSPDVPLMTGVPLKVIYEIVSYIISICCISCINLLYRKSNTIGLSENVSSDPNPKTTF